MNAKSLQTQMVAARGTLGLGAVLAPRVMGRVFGVDPADNPVSPYLMRLFGIRELFMAWDMHNTGPEDLERKAASAIPVDGGDAVASALAGFAGYLPPRAAVMSTATALLGTVHGVLLRSESRKEGLADAQIDQQSDPVGRVCD